MQPSPKPRFSRVKGSEWKVTLLVAVIFSTVACQPPAETLALQCMTGSAEWSPIVLDLTHPSVGGHPAAVTDSDIRWETITRNGFGGATHTQYEMSRISGAVTVENIYVDPKGNRIATPGRYTGECYVTNRGLVASARLP